MLNTRFMEEVGNKFNDSKIANKNSTVKNLQDLSSFLKDYFLDKDYSFNSINLNKQQAD